MAPRPSLVDRLPGWTVPAILLGVPLLFAIVSWLSPAFYDHVVWQYYWGPIKADASGGGCLIQDGVPGCSGYNRVNTLSWAALLGVCILGAAQVLRHTRTVMTTKLVVGATGWVVAGSVFHVLEDTRLMAKPLQYFFITPPIYLIFAAIAILTLLLGSYLRSVAERSNVHVALQKLWIYLAILVLGYVALWSAPWAQVTHYVNPIWVALFALIPYLAVRAQWLRQGRVDPAGLVGWMSIGWILLSLAYVYSYTQAPWPGVRSPQPILLALLAPVLAAMVCAVAFTWALLGVGRAERRGHKKARDFAIALLVPVNLLLLFAQMLDAWATSIGIDFGPYEEKHVLSAAIIDVTQDIGEKIGFEFMAQHPTFVGFATIKLAVSLLVIYLIDASKDADGAQHPNLIGLVKFSIIMVGIGPGIRDFVRMALGV